MISSGGGGGLVFVVASPLVALLTDRTYNGMAYTIAFSSKMDRSFSTMTWGVAPNNSKTIIGGFNRGRRKGFTFFVRVGLRPWRM